METFVPDTDLNRVADPPCEFARAGFVSHGNELGRKALDLFREQFDVTTGRQGFNAERIRVLCHDSEGLSADAARTAEDRQPLHSGSLIALSAPSVPP